MQYSLVACDSTLKAVDSLVTLGLGVLLMAPGRNTPESILSSMSELSFTMSVHCSVIRFRYQRRLLQEDFTSSATYTNMYIHT